MVRILMALLVIIAGLALGGGALAQDNNNGAWSPMAGSAVDISINANGQAYVVSPGGIPWRWDKIEQRWRQISGRFVRITAAEGNRPWALNADGMVYRYNGLWWEDKDTDVADVAADTHGNVYIAKVDGSIHKWYALRSEWRPFKGPVAGSKVMPIKRLALGPAGHLWAVTNDGRIRSFDGEAWVSLPGRARDIALGGTDVVMIADANGQVRRWNGAQKRWAVVSGLDQAITVAVTPDGKVWAVKQGGAIWANGGIVSEDVSENDDGATKLQAKVPTPATITAKVDVAPTSTAPITVANVPTPTTPTAQGAGTTNVTGSSTGSSDAGDPATISTNDKITFINTRKSAATLAIGADGSVFGLDGGGNVLRWSNKTKAFDSFPGSLVRIAVHPDGHPWGISALGRVFKHTGTMWKQIPNATASDISIGYDGTVLTASAAGKLYKLNDAGTVFKMIPGSGALIAAGPDGTPWTVRSDKLVQRCDVSPCKVYGQKAKSIAVGPDASVWIVSNTNRLMRLSKSEKFETIQTPGHTPQKVAVGPMGYPWVVSSANIALAATYFDRDEGSDKTEAASTAASGTTGTGATASVSSTSVSGFTFSKNMTFETVPFTSLTAGGCPLLVSDAGGVMWAHRGGSKLEVYDENRKKFYPKSTGFDNWDLNVFAIAPNGDVWAYTLNPYTGLYRERNGTTKQYTITGATYYEDVSVGPDGTVYVAAAFNSNRYLYSKAPNSEVFKRFSTYNNVRQVDVGPGGDIWISDANIQARRWNGSSFEKPSNVTFDSADIAVSKVDGTVYARENGTLALYKWNATNESFDKVSNTTPSALGVDGDGRPWICRDSTPVIKRAKD